MLWYAIHLSDLPLEALVANPAHAPAPPPPTSSPLTPPPTVAANQGPVGAPGVAAAEPAWPCVVQNRRIVCVAPALRALGIHPGMTLAAATSLAPTLKALPRQPEQEAAFMHQLALTLLRYSPSLVLHEDGVALEVSASLRLFGGAKKLADQIQQSCSEQGVTAPAMAAAKTHTAAWLLARLQSPPQRSAHARLDQLPLEPVLQAWQQSARLQALLGGVGCQTLGEVRALPRTGLKRRGGSELLNLIERAYGDTPDPITWFEAPPHFAQRLELWHRADNAAALVFAAQRLVQPLAGWLTAQWLAATRVSLRLQHESERRRAIADTKLTLVMAEPTRDAAQITLLLRERLGRLVLPAPVYALSLQLEESIPHAGTETAFWRTTSTVAASERALIDRISARLGAARVQRAAITPDHRPEAATRWLDAHQSPPTSNAAKRVAAPTARQPLRPTWLLRTPQALREVNHQPTLQGQALRLVSRAERIEAGWYDGALASRDYHVAVSADGRHSYWLFRERGGDQPASSGWFLHGVFG